MSASRAEYLWAHMAGLYGHRWVSAYGADPAALAGSEWGLVVQDLTRQQIDLGLDACRRSGEDWPPSAPAFRARCFGIPSFEVVKADLTPRRHRFTRLVWEGIDSYLLARSDHRDAERLIRQAYDYAVARRMDGAELPEEPAGAIAHEKAQAKPASPECARRHIDQINRTLKGAGRETPAPDTARNHDDDHKQGGTHDA